MDFYAKGFVLVELLTFGVIAITVVFVVLLIIDPIEISRKKRDEIRMNDMQLISRAIEVAIDEARKPSAALLCFEIPTLCFGASDDLDINVRKNDGTGWVKVDFKHTVGVNLALLPIDPLLTGPNKYYYYSDGVDFELNAQFESKEYIEKMGLDKGNNANRYELGSKLSLIN